MEDKSFESEAGSFDSDIGDETDARSQNEESKIKNSELIQSISDILSKILEENKKLPNIKEIISKQNKMCFSYNSIPKISIKDYLERIQEYTCLEQNTLILSLIYIDRLCEIGKIILTYYNIHKILFGAILIAIKYNEDNFYDNKYYAKIAGVKISELKLMELNFIRFIDYQMFVPEEIFTNYRDYLNSLSKNQSLNI
jgi:hypothetical protein